MKIQVTKILLVDVRENSWDRVRKPRVSGAEEGVNQTIFSENAARFTQRQITKELKPVVQDIIDGLGVPEFFSRDNIKWSQKAGCACGCSPAFTLDASSILFPFDIYFDYVWVDENAVVDNKKVIAVATRRRF